eukprot:gb/GFBE01011801.1/.p1 GENE.gb/GFBE01011801.1/~~gb/GFBE01011801.1/.p1  ORF type:complete len:627 (+),score=126.40 gb/GFBE01011801.1/:1-1881(+)
MSYGLCVGTYLAEQVATSNYELVAVTQADSKRRPASSQIGANAVPGSPDGKIKRRLKDQSNFKATVLPALVSIDPLLQGQADPSIAAAKEHAAQQQETQRKCRVEHIRISSARLMEGRSTWSLDRPAMPLTDRPATRGDTKAIAALTQPLPWFTAPARDSSPPREMSSSSRSGKVGKSRKTHTNPWDLFREGLRGTPMESNTGQRGQRPSSPVRRTLSPPRSREGFKLNLQEQPLVPEDPVEAYFQQEKVRREQKQQKQNEDSTPAKPSLNRLRNLVKGGVLKAVKEPASADEGKVATKPLNSFMNVVVTAAKVAEKQKLEKLRDEVLDALFPKQKISVVRRELCQMMRLFVLGAVGTENCRGKKEREAVFYETCGSKDDMRKLLTAWDKIDADGSGRVDQAELRSFGDRLMIDVVAANAWSSTVGVSGKKIEEVSGEGENKNRLAGWLATTPPEERAKFAQKLVERMNAVLITARKPNFFIEDIMRLLWSCASDEDLKQMRAWCHEINLTRDKFRAETPPVLPMEEKVALQAVFQFFDKDGGGSVSAGELIASGLMDRDSANKFIREVDTDGSGEIDEEEFCELMCPHGFRAADGSEMGSTPLGQALRFHKESNTWRLKDAPPLP